MPIYGPNYQFLEGQAHSVNHRGNLALGVNSDGDYEPISVAQSGIYLLGAKLYDPAGLVTKSTTANLAMTAFDTTNLRLTFTVPDNGSVRVVMSCAQHGSGVGAYPGAVTLGVLSGSSVVARVLAHQVGVYSNSSLFYASLVLDCVVPGLTPGASLTWDAAYAVEIAGTNSAIKYGGPNNTTGSDAFGAFTYEIWSTA